MFAQNPTRAGNRQAPTAPRRTLPVRLLLASPLLFPLLLSAQTHLSGGVRPYPAYRQSSPPPQNSSQNSSQNSTQRTVPNQSAAPPPPRPAPQRPPNAPAARNGEHLAEWMNRHHDLPVPQQQRALEREPGFHELPAQTQQRMRDRLGQLNTMRPEQRNRILQRNEQLERLSPPERQQVRGAMSQLGSLPDDRRRAVARAFRDLRSMPEPQRRQYLNSPAFSSQYNDQERGTLNNLLSVEPYLPSNHNGPPQQP